ncbi:unnamed protein product [Pleuronectes platessa]|uniref:Uncharacterized protein n=1 Tax=Pleuronectes platessa TaxID=8262 RepID=A0A9N7UTD1_PLEPL|nr:unnamed protein product [Pleuronectes platessa]
MGVGDGLKDTAATGGRQEFAGAHRAHQPRVRSQGHTPRGPSEDGASSRQPSGESSPETSQLRTLVRLPRNASSRVDGRQTSRVGPPHAAGVSRQEQSPAPRDVAQRTARQAAGQQQRTRVNRKPSSKPGSAHTRRLTGPNVCGGQQCCSGWAVARGTNRCIKPFFGLLWRPAPPPPQPPTPIPTLK